MQQHVLFVVIASAIIFASSVDAESFRIGERVIDDPDVVEFLCGMGLRPGGKLSESRLDEYARIARIRSPSDFERALFEYHVDMMTESASMCKLASKAASKESNRLGREEMRGMLLGLLPGIASSATNETRAVDMLHEITKSVKDLTVAVNNTGQKVNDIETVVKNVTREVYSLSLVVSGMNVSMNNITGSLDDLVLRIDKQHLMLAFLVDAEIRAFLSVLNVAEDALTYLLLAFADAIFWCYMYRNERSHGTCGGFLIKCGLRFMFCVTVVFFRLVVPATRPEGRLLIILVHLVLGMFSPLQFATAATCFCSCFVDKAHEFMRFKEADDNDKKFAEHERSKAVAPSGTAVMNAALELLDSFEKRRVTAKDRETSAITGGVTEGQPQSLYA
jgi:hypothetical protein